MGIQGGVGVCLAVGVRWMPDLGLCSCDIWGSHIGPVGTVPGRGAHSGVPHRRTLPSSRLKQNPFLMEA